TASAFARPPRRIATAISAPRSPVFEQQALNALSLWVGRTLINRDRTGRDLHRALRESQKTFKRAKKETVKFYKEFFPAPAEWKGFNIILVEKEIASLLYVNRSFFVLTLLQIRAVENILEKLRRPEFSEEFLKAIDIQIQHLTAFRNSV